MSDRFDVLERFTPLFEAPEPSFERFLRRRDRKRRNQRVAAGVVGIAVFLAAVWVVTSGGPFDRTSTPATSGPTGPVELVGGPDDFILDLETGETTRLPNAILRRVRLDTTSRPRWLPGPRYAAAAGGSTLAFVALAGDGTYQIFGARLDGEGVHQLTHDPIGALSPAWSPDGSSIVYVGSDDDGSRGLFLLDVGTGDVSPVLEGVNAFEPQFTPDGASIVYSGGPDISQALRIVPVAGGESTVFVRPGPGLNDAGNGSISPDGTRVTYLGGGSPLAPDGSPLTFQGEEVTHAGPGRFVSNVDGTGFGLLPGYVSNPAGTWSPDGTRIVCSGADGVSGGGIIVVDVATGDFTRVARGSVAIWLDDHTLLVEAGPSI